MDYVRLGKTGLKVSRLCLGCMTYGSSKWRTWVLDEDAGAAVLQAGARGRDQFLRHRRRLFAGRERAGHRQGAEGIRQAPRGGARHQGQRRDGRATPTTRGLSRKHILDGIDHSLQRLGVDYVDLYQIHRFDYETPIEETLEALNDVVRAGKARYIGASSMYAWQFMKMLAHVAGQRLDAVRLDAAAVQPGLPRGGARDAAAVQGPGHRRDPVVAAGARLPGRRPRRAAARATPSAPAPTSSPPRLYYRDPDHAVVDALTAAGQERGVSNMQLALAWVLRNPDHHLADHRHVQGPPPRRRAGRPEDQAHRRRGEGAGGALRAQAGAGPRRERATTLTRCGRRGAERPRSQRKGMTSAAPTQLRLMTPPPRR